MGQYISSGRSGERRQSEAKSKNESTRQNSILKFFSSSNGEKQNDRYHAKVQQMQNEFKEADMYGFLEPVRSSMDDPNISWREGKPEYTQANLAYFQGKTQNHAKDSLELLVENLVKTWEMEASHKLDFSQWTTVDHDNYQIVVNGNDPLEGSVAKEIGNYNALMEHCPAYKKYGDLSFDDSHSLFRNTFKQGFPWEVLKVLSGPPHVVFTWRHWGIFDGEFRGNQTLKSQKVQDKSCPKSRTVEMYGLIRATLNDNLKIQKLDVFYDPDTFLNVLEGSVPKEKCSGAKSVIGDISQLATEKAANSSHCSK